MSKIAQLKDEMVFFKSLSEVIDVLKSAASAQFRNIQSRVNIKRDFMKKMHEMLALLAHETIYTRYLMELKNAPSLIVCLTSDGGFLGELNTLLVNAAVDKVTHKDDEIVVLGERGARYLEDMGKKHTSFRGISDNIDYKEILPIRAYLLKRYAETRFGRIVLVYPQFISMSHRKVERKILLPLQPSFKALSEEMGDVKERKTFHEWDVP
jgi:ATP synthase F1 gamma subunit